MLISLSPIFLLHLPWLLCTSIKILIDWNSLVYITDSVKFKIDVLSTRIAEFYGSIAFSLAECVIIVCSSHLHSQVIKLHENCIMGSDTGCSIRSEAEIRENITLGAVVVCLHSHIFRNCRNIPLKGLDPGLCPAERVHFLGRGCIHSSLDHYFSSVNNVYICSFIQWLAYKIKPSTVYRGF